MKSTRCSTTKAMLVAIAFSISAAYPALAVPHTTNVADVIDESVLVLYGVVTAVESGDLCPNYMTWENTLYGPLTLQVKEVLSGLYTFPEARIKYVYMEAEHAHLQELILPGDEVVVFAEEVSEDLLTLAGDHHGLFRVQDESGCGSWLLKYIRKMIRLYAISDETERCDELFEEIRRGQLSASELYYFDDPKPCIEEHLDEILELLDSEKEAYIFQAFNILNNRLYGIRLPQAIPRLIELTKGSNRRIIAEAAQALYYYDSPEVHAALVALTKHEDPSLRSRACIELRGRDSEKAVKAVTECLRDPEASVRATAVYSYVGWFRDDMATALIPKVAERLSDIDRPVRLAAVRVLGETKNSAAPAFLLPLLAEEEDKAFLNAVLASLALNADRDAHRFQLKPHLNRIIAIAENPAMAQSEGHSSPAQEALKILYAFAAHEDRAVYGVVIKRLAEEAESSIVREDAKRKLDYLNQRSPKH